MVTLAGVMTVRLPRPALSLALLVLAGALVLAWWRLPAPAFAVVAITVVTISAVTVGLLDTFRQTNPDPLASRGIYPDDRALPVYDPGLRRDFSPMLSSSVTRRITGQQARPGKATKRTAAPRPAGGRPSAVRGGPPAALPPARPRPARSAQPRQRAELLAPGATVNFARERREADIEDLFAALDRELIGLVPVKQKVAQIGALLMVDMARQGVGLSATRPNLHMCFTGAPGTGKTTVALLMADLLHRLGYLQTGQLVHAMRDDLVWEYIGQTAPKTKYVLSRAMGGVLFIDEAYSLYRDDDSRDYGQECVDILMQVMENNRDSLVVILAGYKDRMERFFESNPGMRSRLAHHLDFAAYLSHQLVCI